jgi:hypothetical protein
MSLFGLTGPLGLAADACLGWKLWRPVRNPKSAGGGVTVRRAPRCACPFPLRRFVRAIAAMRE